MAKILYARVSTQEQNLARQLTEADGYDKVYVEKISGKNMDRPQLNAMLDYVREGDVLEVESYSRLARNTKDLLEIVEQLNDKGVSFKSKKEDIDTSTPQGRLMLTIFAGLAQFEREQTRQRQDEGIAIKKQHDAELKAMGLPAETYKGRKPIAVDEKTFKEVVKKWKSGEITARKAMQMLDLKPNTFYRRVKATPGSVIKPLK